jgi:hypothetical protein
MLELDISPADQPALLEVATCAAPALTRAHYSRLRFYWVNRRAGIQGGVVDLDLQTRGFIKLNDGGYSYAATEAGVAELAAETERTRARRAPHHELGGRVAQWLQEKGRMTWEGVEFRVRETDCYARAKVMDIAVTDARGILYACPRPDVFSVMATFNPDNINPIVHEVKVSRADFLADVGKPLKRLAYACIAENVYYVLPAGLVEPAEVPKACGLVVEEAPGQFRVLKRAKKAAVTLKPEHFMNMVLKPGASSSTLASD